MKAHPALVATVFVAVLAGIWDQLWVPWSAERDALESTVAEARELNAWVTEKIPLLSASDPVQQVLPVGPRHSPFNRRCVVLAFPVWLPG